MPSLETFFFSYLLFGLPLWLSGKESTYNMGDLGSIPELERSPGEGKGYPLPDSGLENSTDCIVYRVTKSQTWLSDFHLPSFGLTFFNFLKKWIHFISTIGLFYIHVLNIYFVVLLQGSSSQLEASLAPYLHPKRTFAKVWRHFGLSQLRVEC